MYKVRCSLLTALSLSLKILSTSNPLFHCPFSASLRRKPPFKLSAILYGKGKRPKKGVLSFHAAVLMAAPPVKSQPLHNFSFPLLKWAHKNSSTSNSHHHRFRRRDSPYQHPQSYPRPTNPKEQPPTENVSVWPARDEENGEAKPSKLRPRKVVVGAASTAKKETGAPSNDCKSNSNNNGVRSHRFRSLVEGGQQNGGSERKSKRKIWISLSREEIEEDIYALTGGKPARRSRKWPKNVQKQLDNVFPGLYLVGVAADSYRVMML